MGRVWLAFKVFFEVLFSATRAEQIRRVEESFQAEEAPVVKSAAPVEKPAAKPSAPGRSEAISLLETLQREARLLDFIQEDIDTYSDQQVGSAVREIHRGCRSVLQRIFGIVPVIKSEEGEQVTVQSQDEASHIRLTGQVVETRPVTGTLVHAGWRAERCELPQWTGSKDAALILCPAEVELSS